MDKLLYKLTVEYCDDDCVSNDLTSPLITFDINYKGCNIKWAIYDINSDDLETWLNIRKSMLNMQSNEMKVKYPVSFGRGGYSSWYCWCKGDLFELHYDINGVGGDGGDGEVTISIPSEEMLDCVNDIIAVLECASKNIKYIHKEKEE